MLTLTACGLEQEIPNPITSTSSSPTAPSQPSGTPTPEPKTSVEALDGDPSTVDGVTQEESSQQASPFWSENIFGIDPDSVTDSYRGSEQVAHFGTVANAVLAQLSEASGKSVLQSPYVADSAKDRDAIMTAFVNKWTTGDAKDRILDAVSKQGTAEFTEFGSQEIFALIPHVPGHVDGFDFGTEKASAREDAKMWDVGIEGLEINTVDTVRDTSVIVSYQRSVTVPVIESNGNNAFSVTVWDVDLELVPGAKGGDWLIENFSFSIA